MIKIILLCFLYPFAIMGALVFYLFEKIEQLLWRFGEFSGLSNFFERMRKRYLKNIISKEV
jgi:hypothetical protein